jgi:hypothetical protein
MLPFKYLPIFLAISVAQAASNGISGDSGEFNIV